MSRGRHSGGRRRDGRGRRGEQAMVPPAEFTSYYGRPVINAPVWKPLNIAGYMFLGGLAGASSLLGAGAHLTGRPVLERSAKSAAAGAMALSMVALVHDLGRPARFGNMIRVLKVTSPMSVGSWLLTGYVPLAGAAAASALTRRAPRAGAAATAGAALLGPAIAAYTGALISDTAVPAWHDSYREMPFIFVGSAAAAAGGLGLITAPAAQAAPARNLALLGASLELAASERMNRRPGITAEAYRAGTGGALLRVSKALSVLGAAGAVLGTRSRTVSAAAGAALLAASAATRFGVFHAGLASARDPRYTIVPQRERLDSRTRAPSPARGSGAGPRSVLGR